MGPFGNSADLYPSFLKSKLTFLTFSARKSYILKVLTIVDLLQLMNSYNKIKTKHITCHQECNMMVPDSSFCNWTEKLNRIEIVLSQNVVFHQAQLLLFRISIESIY